MKVTMKTPVPTTISQLEAGLETTAWRKALKAEMDTMRQELWATGQRNSELVQEVAALKADHRTLMETLNFIIGFVGKPRR
jgi:hypothetical protein